MSTTLGQQLWDLIAEDQGTAFIGESIVDPKCGLTEDELVEIAAAAADRHAAAARKLRAFVRAHRPPTPKRPRSRCDTCEFRDVSIVYCEHCPKA